MLPCYLFMLVNHLLVAGVMRRCGLHGCRHWMHRQTHSFVSETRQRNRWWGRHLASRTRITHPLHQSWPLFLISRPTNNIFVLPFHWAIILCHCCQRGAPPLPSLPPTGFLNSLQDLQGLPQSAPRRKSP